MDDDSVHFGTGVTLPWWRKLLTGRTIVVVLAVVLLVAAALLYNWHNSVLKSNKRKEDALNSAISTAMADRAVFKWYQSYVVLKPVEADAITKQDKVRYYSLMYLITQTNGRDVESLTYLDKKHQADPSTIQPDALIMAEQYQQLGYKDKALTEYKLALKYQNSLPTSQQNAESITESKQAIQSLGGQP